MPRGARLAAVLAAHAALAPLALQLELRREGPGLAERSPAGLKPRQSLPKFRQTMQNQGGFGMQYTAAVSVGGQAIQGVLDTGSYELLVFSTKCDTCGDVRLYYNESRSPSLEQGHLQVSHSFGSGDTLSTLAYESVQIGPLQSQRQYFWQVIGADLSVANNAGFQAIVGVGPPSTPRTDSLEQAQQAKKLRTQAKADPTIQASEGQKAATRDALDLAEELTLLENFGVMSFSVCIRRPEGSEGYFTWNDDDPRTLPQGLFRAVPVAGDVTWGVSLSNVRMQAAGSTLDTISCQGGCGALLDSGTSLLVVPTEAAQQALQALNTLHSDCSNLDLLPHLVFELGGESFSLPPQAYIGQFIGELPRPLERFAKKADRASRYRACELLIMTMDIQTQLGPMWILGLPFFREYYTTFSLGADIWDQTNRSLYFAEADEGCYPQMPSSGPHALAQRSVRQVDLSAVRVPDWVTSAAAAGWVTL